VLRAIPALASLVFLGAGAAADAATASLAGGTLDFAAGAGAGAASDGADDIDCGSGVDRVSYAERITRVVVSLDASALDGEDANADGDGEEGDFARASCEDVVGGAGGDLLAGGPGSNRLLGGLGNDTLVTVANGDTLEGGSGDDDLLAPNGVADTLIGGETGEVAGDTGQ